MTILDEVRVAAANATAARKEANAANARYRAASTAAQLAANQRDELVRGAVLAGVPLSQVAGAAGLTRQRVAQIIGGRGADQ